MDLKRLEEYLYAHSFYIEDIYGDSVSIFNDDKYLDFNNLYLFKISLFIGKSNPTAVSEMVKNFIKNLPG